MIPNTHNPRTEVRTGCYLEADRNKHKTRTHKPEIKFTADWFLLSLERCIIQSILQPSKAKKNIAHQMSDEMSLLLRHKIASISTSLGMQNKLPSSKKASKWQRSVLFSHGVDLNIEREPNEGKNWRFAQIPIFRDLKSFQMTQPIQHINTTSKPEVQSVCEHMCAC